MAIWPCTCTKYESGRRDVELTCREHGDHARDQIKHRILAGKPRPWDQWVMEGTREEIVEFLAERVKSELWQDHIVFVTSVEIYEAWKGSGLPYTFVRDPGVTGDG